MTQPEIEIPNVESRDEWRAARIELLEKEFTRKRDELLPGPDGLGRQEDWEEPPGRITGLGAQAGCPGIRYPDEFDGSEGQDPIFVNAEPRSRDDKT